MEPTFTPLVYNEREVAHLLRVDRSTVRRQALTAGTALHTCVIYVTEQTRRYPRAAIHALVGDVTDEQQKAA